jgi:putative addiction module component (TIGR02574 family)
MAAPVVRIVDGMTHHYALSQALKLTVEERLELVEEIWDSIAADAQLLPLTDSERTELDRRVEAYHRDPSDTVSWDELERRLLDRESQA